MGIQEHTITFTLCEGDFEISMNRKPRSQREFDDWAKLCEKGLANGPLDWGIVYACARQVMGEPC
ncbi:MAG: hypothetical protein JXA69_08375 [Phycisphaerae bacterium]|nr:hypothetical protein [Phycisphaerae bacterium]